VAETTPINPKIPVVTKVKLLAYCQERHYSQGEVVAAALEAYFAPADTEREALVFQKIQGLEQSVQEVAGVLGQKMRAIEMGLEAVVGLLGTVIQHLETQAKPGPVKVATAPEMYQTLYQQDPPSDGEALPADAPAPSRRSPWGRLFGRKEPSV
jgi:hypothetical protein